MGQLRSHKIGIKQRDRVQRLHKQSLISFRCGIRFLVCWVAHHTLAEEPSSRTLHERFQQSVAVWKTFRCLRDIRLFRRHRDTLMRARLRSGRLFILSEINEAYNCKRRDSASNVGFNSNLHGINANQRSSGKQTRPTASHHELHHQGTCIVK